MNEIQTVPSNPFLLLERALEKGIDADQLGKLVQLNQDWQDRKARMEYAAAMQACQAEMPSVLRTKKGENSKYAPLEEVHSVIKQVYLQHGFSLSFGELPATKPDYCNISCDVRHTGGHTERLTLEGGLDVAGPKGGATKTPIQGKGSTMSYLRRYLTLLIFNVTVENEDRDGMSQAQMVGPEQIKLVNELIEECEAAGRPVTFDKFIKWLGVESLDQLTMPGFTKAVVELNRRRKAVKPAAV
jgi:hypothetical protein